MTSEKLETPDQDINDIIKKMFSSEGPIVEFLVICRVLISFLRYDQASSKEPLRESIEKIREFFKKNQMQKCVAWYEKECCISNIKPIKEEDFKNIFINISMKTIQHNSFKFSLFNYIKLLSKDKIDGKNLAEVLMMRAEEFVEKIEPGVSRKNSTLISALLTNSAQLFKNLDADLLPPKTKGSKWIREMTACVFVISLIIVDNQGYDRITSIVSSLVIAFLSFNLLIFAKSIYQLRQGQYSDYKVQNSC